MNNAVSNRLMNTQCNTENKKSLFTYNNDGALTERVFSDMFDIVNLREFFEYNAGGMLKTYRKVDLSSAWEWKYRQSALGGREQKRLYVGPELEENPDTQRPWTYYLLGAGGEQLAVYHGSQFYIGLPDEYEVYMRPSSYLTAGGAIERRLSSLNADGFKNYRLQDHIGSTRTIISLDLSDNTTSFQSFNYKPFGDVYDSTTIIPRLSWRDAKNDFESSYTHMGARQYDPVLGRFLSVDTSGFPRARGL